jgi:hypothetical protein
MSIKEICGYFEFVALLLGGKNLKKIFPNKS